MLKRGFKKFDNFVDINNGSPLSAARFSFVLAEGLNNGSSVWQDEWAMCAGKLGHFPRL